MFSSFNPDGTTKTFFKPPEGIRYWQEQIVKDIASWKKGGGGL